MPQIIPIRDLKDTANISAMCSETTEPIYITKNGYGDMVIMNAKVYDEKIAKLELYADLMASENDIKEGRVHDASEQLKALRTRLDV